MLRGWGGGGGETGAHEDNKGNGIMGVWRGVGERERERMKRYTRRMD